MIFRLNALVNFPLPFGFFSGDPHQFEQKFNYRRPMYPILKYMWAKDDYRESVKVKITYFNIFFPIHKIMN